MTEHPDSPDDQPDPFEALPEALRDMLGQLGGPDAIAELQKLFGNLAGEAGGGLGNLGDALGNLFGGAGTDTPSGPVDWNLARRIAIQLADENDREPSDQE
ncbi:MAG: hypothetical protein ACI867_000505, partial [Glaciecola sp.]